LALVVDSSVLIGVIAGLGVRPSIVACVLADLSAPEQACLELAWQALLAGTIPIGAVVADADGIIIRSGRNAVYGHADPPLISGSLIAHAEINALSGLPVTGSHPDCRLVTSMEPCQMCTGALRMATVGALTYLGADPVNGTSWVLESARYVGHWPIAVKGPRPDDTGLLASGMVAAYHLRNRPHGRYVAACRSARPDLLAVGAALTEAGMFELAADRQSWPVAAPALLAAVKHAA
jgi:tRNA(Arg) A34 adenosine deaminase TadA